MVDHEHPGMSDDADIDEAVARELALLGALLQSRARAEREPPTQSFVESLWARLVYDDVDKAIGDGVALVVGDTVTANENGQDDHARSQENHARSQEDVARQAGVERGLNDARG